MWFDNTLLYLHNNLLLYNMNIDRLLKEKGITKAQLAERMGILPQNVNANLKNPKEDTIRNIAVALGVPIYVLFEDEDDTSNAIVCPKCGARFELTE